MHWVDKDFDYSKGIFSLTYQRSNPSIKALEAAVETVNYICQNYPAPYTLMLSGGVDSQAMLYAWIKSKQKFETFSAIYTDNINLFDVVTIQEFADRYGIKINYVNFDVVNFLETEHKIYSDKYICGSPHFTTYMKLSDLVGHGTTIFSGSFIIRGRIQYFWSRNELGLLHYAILGKKNCVPFFFNETQNLTYAFRHNGLPDVVNDYYNKVTMYQYNNFPVIPQADKFSGFEKLKERYDTIEHPLLESLKSDILAKTGNPSRRNFDLLYRNKFEAKFKNHKYIYLPKACTNE